MTISQYFYFHLNFLFSFFDLWTRLTDKESTQDANLTLAFLYKKECCQDKTQSANIEEKAGMGEGARIMHGRGGKNNAWERGQE